MIRGSARLLVLLPGLLPWLLAPTGLQALSHTEATALFDQANALFRAANKAAVREQNVATAKAAGSKAAGSTASELYGRSAALYIQLAQQIPNGRLYYNAGNAYYRAGDLGRAILNYKRALTFMPSDTNLRRNLEEARSRRVDDIENRETGSIAGVLLFWHHDLAPSTRALALSLFVLLSVLSFSAFLLFREKLRIRSLPSIAGASGALAMVLFISLAVDQGALVHRREGVVVSRQVVARKGDGVIYHPAFDQPLHAGTEFVLREDRSSWYRVELADGRICWLPAKAVELVSAP